MMIPQMTRATSLRPLVILVAAGHGGNVRRDKEMTSFILLGLFAAWLSRAACLAGRAGNHVAPGPNRPAQAARPASPRRQAPPTGLRARRHILEVRLFMVTVLDARQGSWAGSAASLSRDNVYAAQAASL